MDTAVLEVNGLCLRKGRQEILSDINLRFCKSEHWVVFGPNGCGKTSLLSVLNGHQWPSSGVVKILGSKLGRVDIRKIRQNVGRISYRLQLGFQRVATQVEEVVASGFFDSIGLQFNELDKGMLEAVVEILETLDIKDFRDRSFQELSYGEQKKVLLARALVHKPALLVLDEPFEGLDIVSKQMFLETVESILLKFPDLATVWTTHHLEEVPIFCNKVLLLKNGNDVFMGSIEDAFTPKQLSNLFQSPITVVEQNSRRFAFLAEKATS